MNSKIDKPGVMGFKVSIGCPCAALDHQNGTQVPKIRCANSWFGVPGDTQEQHQNPKAS